MPYIFTRIYFWWQTSGAFEMQKAVLDLNSFIQTNTNKLQSLLGTFFYAGE